MPTQKSRRNANYGYPGPQVGFGQEPIISDRAPTIYDNAELGTIWVNTLTNLVWVLTHTTANLAGPVNTWSASAGGQLATLTGDVGGAVSPDPLNNINIIGAHGINTVSDPTTFSVTAAINNTITLGDLGVVAGDALTVASGDVTISNNFNLPQTTGPYVGVITSNNIPIAHSYGFDNLFLGAGSGNFTLTGSTLIGVGNASLNSVTSGTYNIALGGGALGFLTTGEYNVALGHFSQFNLLSGTHNVSVGTNSLYSIDTASSGNTVIGSQALNNAVGVVNNNIAIGNSAATDYANSESNNIVIGNPGLIGDSNVIRIGTNPTHTATYIAGIDGVDVGATAKLVSMGSFGTAGQLGTIELVAGANIILTPSANTITITASGGGASGVDTITGNNGGPISPLAGNINLLTAHATPTFVGAGSTLSLDFNKANLALGSSLLALTIGSENVGMGASALNSIAQSSASVAVGYRALPLLSSGNENVAIGKEAGRNITHGSSNTAIGFIAGATLSTGSNNTYIGASVVALAAGESDTIRLGNTTQLSLIIPANVAIDVPTAGSISIGATTANLLVLNHTQKETRLPGHLVIENSTAATGIIYKGTTVAAGVPFLHNCNNSTAVGISALAAVVAGGAGANSAAYGLHALKDLTSGNNNTALGTLALITVTTGASNIAVGYNAGSAYTGAESSNICIGSTGVIAESNKLRIGLNGNGAGQQNACWIAGIDGVNVGSVAKVVTMDSNQLGTATITAGTGITVTPGANSITIASSITAGVQTITGNSGGALSPSGGTINIVTANSTVTFAGSGATETMDFNITNLVLGSTLPSLAGGTQNVGVGTGVLNGTTTGINNVAVGKSAAAAVTSGESNVALGSSALTAITSGKFNIAIGTSASAALTTAVDNIAIGYFAFTAATSGPGNIALGNVALNKSISGASNIAIGYAALGVLTTGVSNVALGDASGGVVTTGSRNIYIGAGVGAASTSETGTTRIGSAQTACYIDGIDGYNVGSVARVVTEASDRLGTATITAGAGITITPTANTITVASTAMSVWGSSADKLNSTDGIRYIPFFSWSTEDPSSSATNYRMAVPCAGTFKNMYVNATANGNTASGTYTLRVNSTDSALVVTVTASTTGVFSNTANAVTVAAGDLVIVKVSQASTNETAGAITVGFISA